jgi:hypothetical protein
MRPAFNNYLNFKNPKEILKFTTERNILGQYNETRAQYIIKHSKVRRRINILKPKEIKKLTKKTTKKLLNITRRNYLSGKLNSVNPLMLYTNYIFKNGLIKYILLRSKSNVDLSKIYFLKPLQSLYGKFTNYNEYKKNEELFLKSKKIHHLNRIGCRYHKNYLANFKRKIFQKNIIVI